MKFALVCGKRTEAIKGAQGICPGCGSGLVARCGTIKVNHWAHKGNRNCDPWWEPETEWHRSWKNNFPAEWQEIVLHDEHTNEKHIADVRTSYGFVIEFQHSHIDPEERTSRENFYKNMVWIVDGTRLKRDYPRFLKGKSNFRKSEKKGYFFVSFLEECFPSYWLGSSVPVIFDFRGIELISDLKDLRNSIYCLFPKKNNGETILAVMLPEAFINITNDGKLLTWIRNMMDIIKQPDSEYQNTKQPISNNIRIKESQYVLERGKWKRRIRF
jgi:hypothetical protein